MEIFRNKGVRMNRKNNRRNNSWKQSQSSSSGGEKLSSSSIHSCSVHSTASTATASTTTPSIAHVDDSVDTLAGSQIIRQNSIEDSDYLSFALYHDLEQEQEDQEEVIQKQLATYSASIVEGDILTLHIPTSLCVDCSKQQAYFFGKAHTLPHLTPTGHRRRNSIQDQESNDCEQHSEGLCHFGCVRGFLNSSVENNDCVPPPPSPGIPSSPLAT
mmetsp:Transcript_29/g.49  ORF Transcript_29/g.49 Transcript_29/m.49 type:complete len:215 (-) Transcript_29:3230-3874(-)